MGPPARPAAPQKQPPVGGRVPVRTGEAVGLRQIEPATANAATSNAATSGTTTSGTTTSAAATAAHQNNPSAPSTDHDCQDMPNSPTTEMSAIIEFCPCSAQSWIISTR